MRLKSFLSLAVAISFYSNAFAISNITDGDSSVEVNDSGDGYIFFQEDNSEKMRITGGNVGIGDTTPDGKLEINPNGTEDDGDELVVKDSGKVGIGEINPAGKLEVSGGGTILTSLSIQTGGCGTNQVTLTGSPNLSGVAIGDIFYDDIGTAFVITGVNDGTDIINFTGQCTRDGSNSAYIYRNGMVVTSGRVGIGTRTPESQLHVKDSTNDIYQDLQTNKIDGKAGISLRNDAQTWTTGVDGGDSDKYKIGNSNGFSSAKVTVETGGNVGIGTTSPSGRLDVEGGDVFIGTGTLTNSSGNEDLSVTGNVEVDGTIYGNGSGLTSVTASSLNAGSSVVSDAEVDNDITLTDITQVTNRSHTNLSDIGTNTHSQIDSHLSSTTNAHGLTYTVEGTGGGLDADTVDGNHASAFVATTGGTVTGTLTSSNVATDVTTGTNEDYSIVPNGTGKVGIGTTSPGEKLTVNGKIQYGDLGAAWRIISLSYTIAENGTSCTFSCGTKYCIGGYSDTSGVPNPQSCSETSSSRLCICIGR